MSLPVHERALIEHRVANDSRSVGVAYLLWVLAGAIGGHRYYLGHVRLGMAMTGLFVTVLLTLGSGVPVILALIAWVVVDAFLIPGIVSRQRHDLRSSLSSAAMLEAKLNALR